MIGIVIVAHSAALAAGVRALVTQMTGDRVPIAAAGGSTNADEPIGTDPMLVLEAIDAVDQGDDILVLMDLGSAIMSAEAALEFLDDDVRARVYLCEAPVAEGALAAAVQAAAGSDIARVMAEARASLLPKAAQLAPLLRIKPPAAPVTDAVPPATRKAAAHQITVTVPNRLGLHARPAARLVETAARFDAWVRYTCNGRHAAGDSINQIATLGARQGDQLTVATGGPEAEAVLRAVEALAAANFGDTDDAPPAPVAGATAVDAPPGAVTGGSVVPGIALGPALALDRTLPAVETRSIDDPPAEQARLDRAMAGVGAELEAVVVRTRARMAAGDAGIIDAQLLILRDPALAAAARTRIAAAEICAEAAWVAAIQEIVAQYRALADPYMRQRAADVLDIGRRVLAQLTGAPQTVTLDAPAVVVAHEVGPLDVAQFDPDRVLGVVTAVGGATGHAAILLRGLGIPTVMGVGAAVDAVETGVVVGLDGARGLFWPAPDAATQQELTQARQTWLAQRADQLAAAHAPARTRDGVHVRVAANIGSAAEAHVAVRQGADEVGLFRSEFLFMAHAAPPDEATQLAAYRAAAAALNGGQLVVRTLDTGADKPIPYLAIDAEENPFLGLRGIRFSLAERSLLHVQLRALLRAAADHPLAVMFPMVSTLDELRQARAAVDAARRTLVADGLPAGAPPLGVMIETPAAVLLAPALAREVDFFSIGTNDLQQYLMAADRNNPRVAGLVAPVQPPLLHALDVVARAAHDAGIWVGICGELAGDPQLTPLLLGLGIDEVSMNAAAIPAVKAAVRAVTLDGAAALAAHVLSLTTAAEIDAALTQFSAQLQAEREGGNR